MRERPTTFTETLLKTQIQERIDKVKDFLNQDYIQETNFGYKIDVLKIVDTLTEKQKSDLMKYLITTKIEH